MVTSAVGFDVSATGIVADSPASLVLKTSLGTLIAAVSVSTLTKSSLVSMPSNCGSSWLCVVMVTV